MFLCTESASEDEKDESEDTKEAPTGDGQSTDNAPAASAAAWGSVGSSEQLDPAPKKQKLHFGGLNLKKKKNEPAPVEDFSSAPDTFDEW